MAAAELAEGVEEAQALRKRVEEAYAAGEAGNDGQDSGDTKEEGETGDEEQEAGEKGGEEKEQAGSSTTAVVGGGGCACSFSSTPVDRAPEWSLSLFLITTLTFAAVLLRLLHVHPHRCLGPLRLLPLLLV
jgi:hypothetical protein